MSYRVLRWLAALSPVALLFVATCYAPDIGDGAFACGPNGLCPHGFVCRTNENLCYRTGEPPDASVPIYR